MADTSPIAELQDAHNKKEDKIPCVARRPKADLAAKHRDRQEEMVLAATRDASVYGGRFLTVNQGLVMEALKVVCLDPDEMPEFSLTGIAPESLLRIGIRDILMKGRFPHGALRTALPNEVLKLILEFVKEKSWG